MYPFWYSNVTADTDLKARLCPEGVERLHSPVVTRMLHGGRTDLHSTDLDVLILDQKGTLVSTSGHVALVVDGVTE